mmetsp:Transcript_15684/g.49075  ORF Transcript_15684/g.49075 Transcript_15684/m.49075 type:complete len:387 (-) Transcript_15684:204-1364(-)
MSLEDSTNRSSVWRRARRLVAGASLIATKAQTAVGASESHITCSVLITIPPDQLNMTVKWHRYNACKGLPPEYPYGERFLLTTASDACNTTAYQFHGWCRGAYITTDTFPETEELYPDVPPDVGNSCTTDVVRSVAEPPEWSHYNLMRIASQLCHCSKQNCTEEVMETKQVPTPSIAQQVYDGCKGPTTAGTNVTGTSHIGALLQAVISGLGTVEAPPTDALVVHLRVGDVLEDSASSVSRLLATEEHFGIGEQTDYVKTFSYYDKSVPDDAIKNRPVVLVAAAHSGAGSIRFQNMAPRPVKSCLYIHLLRKYFASRGASEVILRLGNTPDDDIYYMSQATSFVPSGGYYSRLVFCVITHRGTGNLYAPLDYWSDRQWIHKCDPDA